MVSIWALCSNCNYELHFLCDGPAECGCLCQEDHATPSDLEFTDGLL